MHVTIFNTGSKIRPVSHFYVVTCSYSNRPFHALLRKCGIANPCRCLVCVFSWVDRLATHHRQTLSEPIKAVNHVHFSKVCIHILVGNNTNASLPKFSREHANKYFLLISPSSLRERERERERASELVTCRMATTTNIPPFLHRPLRDQDVRMAV